jgi:hypothetical protein
MKACFTPLILFTVLFLMSTATYAQTTAFNFQGRLNDGTLPANGQYDLQFKLFSVIAGGSQVGATVDRPNLTLINGVFSTTLDFGSAQFSGGNRFIEISVRPAGSQNAHVVLGARQQIMSVPYAVRSVSAGVADTALHAFNADAAVNSFSLGGHSAIEYARLDFANPGTLRIDGNISTNSNIGVGTGTPSTRLTISGGPSWTSANWTASMNMQNASALGWEANNAGQRFGIGQTNGGLYFFRTTSPFGSTSAPAQADLAIADNGNLTQPVERNGMMKAMVAVTANGTIVRCYNGVTGSTTGNCGISVKLNGTPEIPLGFLVNFPFDVSNRFWIVTAERSGSGLFPQTAGVDPIGSGGLQVTTHYDGSLAYRPFHLFVY